ARVFIRPETPSDEFIANVERFEGILRQWMNRYRYGASAHDAWPEPPTPSSLGCDQSSAESDDANTACANQNDAPTNINAASPDEPCPDANTAAPAIYNDASF